MNTAFFFSQNILWGILCISVAVFIILGIILGYHWQQFGIDDAVTRRMKRIYFLVGGLLMLLQLGVLISLHL